MLNSMLIPSRHGLQPPVLPVKVIDVALAHLFQHLMPLSGPLGVCQLESRDAGGSPRLRTMFICASISLLASPILFSDSVSVSWKNCSACSAHSDCFR